MDLKQLFHHPEDLDDAELNILRDKIRMQQYMPYYGAIFSTLAWRVVDSQIFMKKSCPRYLAAAAVLGFCIGAQGANTLHSSLWRGFDGDIQRAFDQRFMR